MSATEIRVGKYARYYRDYTIDGATWALLAAALHRYHPVAAS